MAERWIATVRRELLDRTLILNRRHLTAVLTEYMAHLNRHRAHRPQPSNITTVITTICGTNPALSFPP